MCVPLAIRFVVAKRQPLLLLPRMSAEGQAANAAM